MQDSRFRHRRRHDLRWRRRRDLFAQTRALETAADWGQKARALFPERFPSTRSLAVTKRAVDGFARA